MAKIAIRRQLFQYQIAEGCISHAQFCCEQLIQFKDNFENESYVPLTIAMHSLYARPFGANDGIAALKLNLVPKEFHQLHRDILAMRSKLYIHHDVAKDSALKMSNNEIMIKAYIEKSGIKCDLGYATVLPNVNGLQKIYSLILIIRKKISIQLQEIQSLFNDEIALMPDGRYQIDIHSSDEKPSFQLIRS